MPFAQTIAPALPGAEILSIEPVLSAELPSQPVEGGGERADTRYTVPAELTATLAVHGADLPALSSAIRRHHDEGTLFTVTARSGDYADMAIASVSHVEDGAENYESVTFTVTFRQILRVASGASGRSATPADPENSPTR